MSNSAYRVAVVTGGSSGIGRATARALARLDYRVVIGALDSLMTETWDKEGLMSFPLDVTLGTSVDAFAAGVGSVTDHVDVLVNAAGLALGQDPVSEALEADWQTTLDTNVMGMMRTIRAILPLIRQSSSGHIVNIGSAASFDCYPGGGSYAASKHAVLAITQTLRLELNGEPIRVTQIDPGITQTRFTEVRFKGDRAREDAVYAGITPLTADDVGECVVFAVTRPPHVNIDRIIVRPLDQAASYMVARHPEGAGKSHEH